MKPTERITTLALAGLLAALPVASAQEGNKKGAKAKAVAAKTERERGFLGVQLLELPEILRAHLEIDEGVGLLVGTVAPDSPAENAGVLAKDVVVRLDEQIITSPQQLSTLVSNRDPGSKATLGIFRKGQEKDLQVVLGKAPAASVTAVDANGVAHQLMKGGLGPRHPLVMQFGGPGGNLGGAATFGIDQQNMLENLRKQLEGHGIQLDSLMKGGAFDPGSGISVFQGGSANGAPGHSSSISVVSSDATSINISDGEHSISLYGSEGEMNLKAKSADGEVIYDGPYNTEAEKKKVPAEVRKKIESAQGMIKIAPAGKPSGKAQQKPEPRKKAKEKPEGDDA